MTTAYEFAVGFKKAGAGTAPSSAPTITVIDSANNVLVAALTAVTALTNLTGAYRYSYSGADGLICYAKFVTTDLTMDESEIFCAPNINPAVRAIHVIDTAIKAVTDQMSFTVANQVDANALTGGGGGGSGSTSKTQTVTDGVNPLDGVNVWVSTDITGLNVIAQGFTDALGHVTFMLDPGTYYFWKQLAGYTFTNPQADTV